MAAADGSVHNVVKVYMDNRTPLMKALSQKDKDQIESLLENGEDVNFMWTERTAQSIARSRKGSPMSRYPVEFAAESSSLEVVKFLVDRGARLDISNALHAAAAGHTEEDEMERVKIIEFLLEKGMDINKLEFAGEEDYPKQYENRAYGTPLHYAAEWGWAGIVECLLKNGADPNIESICYKTKLHCGTALDWQRSSEPDEGTYSRRVLVLLGHKKDKL